MKQLKIIADQYNSQSSVSQARFNESITLAPKSRIWLDKISMNILSSGGDGTYTIGAQTITFCPNRLTGSAASPYKTFAIPAGTYTLPQLLVKIQDGFNSSLNSNPAFNSIGTVCDLGLGFLVTSQIPPPPAATQPVVSISFVGTTCTTQTDAIPTNFVLAGDTWGPTVASPITSQILWPTRLLSGALLIETSLYTTSGTIGNNECSFGLYNALPVGGLQYGISFANGDWYIVSGLNVTLITNQAIFDNGGVNWRNKKYCFYIDPVDTAANGLRFSIIDDPTKTILYTTPIGAFAGYTTESSYFFNIEEQADVNPLYFLDPYITYQPNTATDNVGTYIDFASIGAQTYLGGTTAPSLTTFPVLPLTVVPVRNVVIKFLNSVALAFGLGFGTTTLPTIVGSSGTITAANAVNFVNFVDLAVDILNLPLESYISSSGTTGRTNTLAYFTPQPQNSTSTSLYSYENKNITFIDINNREPLVIESLQYRVYNPQDLNSFFVFSNLSMTLFVSEQGEGMNVRIASA